MLNILLAYIKIYYSIYNNYKYSYSMYRRTYLIKDPLYFKYNQNQNRYYYFGPVGKYNYIFDIHTLAVCCKEKSRLQVSYLFLSL